MSTGSVYLMNFLAVVPVYILVECGYDIFSASCLCGCALLEVVGLGAVAVYD